MLTIDLTGKHAFVAGVADDGGFGFGVQVRGVVVLVEGVDDDLPVDRYVPGQLLDQLHVFHPVRPEVGRDLGAEPFGQRRRSFRVRRVPPTPSRPLRALDRRRGNAGQLVLVEVLPVGDADDRTLVVVEPAVPATPEPARIRTAG